MPDRSKPTSNTTSDPVSRLSGFILAVTAGLLLWGLFIGGAIYAFSG